MASKKKGQTPKKPVLFLSIDVEADGPCPGLNNLWSVGLAGFTETAELVFEYEANLHDIEGCTSAPSTMEWWATQGEAFEYVRSNLQDPVTVFPALRQHILDLKNTYVVVVVAWPVSYDFMWFCYYFGRFCPEGNPFGHSAQCIEGYAWAMSRNRKPSDRINLEQWADPRFSHTHKALDDAKEQGAMFLNMYRENIAKK